MSDETPAPDHAGPLRLTIPGEGDWRKPIPWIVEVPLLAIMAYLIVAGPLDPANIIPALGIAATIVVVALPGLAQLTRTNRAWAHRSATVDDEGITVDMPGRGSQHWAWADLSRVTTRTIAHGMQFPQLLFLVSDFYDSGGERIPELTVHHSSHRAIVHKAEVNPQGPEFLAALERTPVVEVFDLGTRTLLDLVLRPETETLGALSEETLEQLRAGRLWHARRTADEDKRTADRVPDVLVRISYLLRRNAQRTAREAALERPDDPLVRYYLAHAILADVRAAAALQDPAAVRRRQRLRDEAHSILQGLREDSAYGEVATRDLAALELRAITRDAGDADANGLIIGRAAAADAASVRAAERAAQRRAAREAERQRAEEEAEREHAEREEARRAAWRENLVLTPGRQAREEEAAAAARAAEREAARQRRQGILDPPPPKDGALKRVLPRRTDSGRKG